MLSRMRRSRHLGFISDALRRRRQFRRFRRLRRYACERADAMGVSPKTWKPSLTRRARTESTPGALAKANPLLGV
jgi:hypothetical protein